MAKLKIITGEDNPILRQKSVEVKSFDKKLKKLVKDMKATMIAAEGLGLAAPQVGVNIRLFLMTLDYGKKSQRLITMVNPQISFVGDERYIDEEGCLSLPGQYGKVERQKKISVEYLDADGHKQFLNLSMLNAREVLHENDHLDGVLFIDLMEKSEPVKDLLF